ncbi:MULTISPECIES: type 1 glutamine amidotransferase domain-containing protein [Nocardiopsis]|uniref:Type 1 glutamine amidotransferase domain-containing protein n=1 Tax=Nocardiopsis lambiniae TaxID=3075539 RepID=A0ABU2MFN1_9ACTN|nr:MULTISPECIES: type 1 glutamine amidotransferase domain-containing protein [unclassified Nocardiopsis]MDE3722128.1 type 1 glutamine amidotransferase [Nocardiopsis sp. N85]MDT0331501.1 type 1 glutamine amidotransferase domain-containing protein [Nocardiopsis sp. DSM 44743]
MATLTGRRVAFLAADGVEQVELEQPRRTLREAGADTELLSLKDGEIQAMNGDIEPADVFRVDRRVSEASVDDYDYLVLPGGTVNPDNLRSDSDAIRFVKEFAAAGKPIAAICHGPWVLVEADLVRGRTVTSYPSIRTDVRNAGGHVVEAEVVTDAGITTSRNPGDLPAFCERIIEELTRA